MTLDPLRDAGPAIQIHLAMAVFAIALTLAIFAVRRGSRLHKALGRVWVAAMAVIAASSFWISGFAVVGPFGPIHLLSIFVLVQLVLAVRAARRGDIATHRRTMALLAFGALFVAGAFTLVPGRLLFEMISGG